MSTKPDIKIASPAKINLFLHVTGKRKDGYHNLVTLMCCIGIYDNIYFTFNTSKISVSCNHPDVPDNENNLAYKAADCFFKRLKISEGVKICIEKNIPVGAGLGGGSSNAGSVLRELNKYYKNRFSKARLADMGLSIGADVPFFIYQKPAIATNIGEVLTPYLGLEQFKILIVFPGFKVSTSDIYKNLNLGLTKCEKKLNYPLFTNWRFDFKKHLCNDLESVTQRIYSEIVLVKDSLSDQGADGVLMSGSGSSVFGIFLDFDLAEKAKKELSKNEKWNLYLTELLV